MNEQTLLLLYAVRDEQAIAETKRTCGRACLQLAKQLLGNDADAEECLADTLLAAWQHIPPDAPDSLLAYLLRITRNKALHRLEERRAKKRGGGEGTVAIDELADVSITGYGTVICYHAEDIGIFAGIESVRIDEEKVKT